MRYSLRFFIVLTLILTSCDIGKSKPRNPIPVGKEDDKLSVNENRGIDEVLDYYGGECSYKKEISVNISSATTKLITLTLKGSPVIENEKKQAFLTASNIALLFYKNLLDEKSRYDQINVQVIKGKTVYQEENYNVEDLDLVLKKLEQAKDLVTKIANDDFDVVKLMISEDNHHASFNIDELLANVKVAKNVFGNITGERFIPLGFYTYDSPKSGKRIIRLSGSVIRDIQSHEFSIDCELDSDVILFMDFKL